MPFVNPNDIRERLADRYEILALVGAGAMGRVYKAIDRELDEIVAVKVLSAALLDHPEMIERFRREVKLARRITHANVARVFDIGEHGRERFLTMEFIDGESLGDVLSREGGLPAARVVAIGRAVAAGLGAAHTAGVIHRDLKPDNVLVSRQGRIVVTDFGIARSMKIDSGAGESVGHVIGTPAYMAPEQVEGVPDIGPQADVYALGAMLFEMLTGQRPWKGASALAIAAARLTNPPPDPRKLRPDLPEELASLVVQCMARERALRPPSAIEVSDALRALEPIAAASAPQIVLSMIPAPADSDAGTTAIGAAATAWAVNGGPQLALPNRHDRALAVLPLRNTGAPGDANVADGLTEELIDQLTMMRGLRVCSRGAVDRFGAALSDPRAVGAELGVHVVAEGSVWRNDDTVRVMVRLVSVSDGFQLWAKRFDGPSRDLLAIAEQIATAMAEALGAERAAAPQKALTDPFVIDLYLRARAASRSVLGSYTTEDPSLALFDQALALAPDNPSVLAGCAIARARQWVMRDEGREEALKTAARAVEIAPELGEARLALAYVSLVDGDPVTSVVEAKRAIALAPASPDGHLLVGRILAEAGYFGEAIRRLEALRQMDPQLRFVHSVLARTYALTDRWDEAFHILDRLAEIDRTVATMDRLRLLFWKGDYDRAMQELEALGEGTWGVQLARAVGPLVFGGQDPVSHPIVAELVARTDVAARRNASLFGQLRAEVAATFGRVDDAIAAIADSVAHGLFDIVWMDRCPVLERARPDPRFAASRAEVAARARRIIDAFLDR